MKERFFYFAIALIVISFITNTIYAQSNKLAQPVFLNHYIEIDANDQSGLQLYYLTNRDDQTAISHINLGDIQGYSMHQNDFYDFDNHHSNDTIVQSFKHHDVRSVYIDLNLHVYYDYDEDEYNDDFDEEYEDDFTNELKERLAAGPLIFDEIDVFFNDGSLITFPIGEIVIKEPQQEPSDLTERSSSSSTDGTSQTLLEVEADLTIEEVTVKVADHLTDQILITLEQGGNSLNHTPGTKLSEITFPLQLKKGDNITIYSKISPHLSAALRSQVTFKGTTASGTAFTNESWLLYHQPYLTQAGVNAMVKATQKGESQ